MKQLTNTRDNMNTKTRTRHLNPTIFSLAPHPLKRLNCVAWPARMAHLTLITAIGFGSLGFLFSAHAQTRTTRSSTTFAPTNALPPMPGQTVAATPAPRLTLTEAPDRFSARIFSANSTFDNIFYKNLVRELEIEKERMRVMQANLLAPSQDLRITKFFTSLPSAQVGEAVEIGLADITILPLAFYQTTPSNTLDLLDYPFMFSTPQQISRKYTAASSVLYAELNARSPDSIPVAIMPYSYRIYASTGAAMPQALKQEALGISESPAIQRTYSYIKSPDSLQINEKNMPSANLIETTILDFYDKRMSEKYKTVYATQHSLKSAVILVGKKWWGTLNAQQRDMLTQALSRTVTKSQEEILNLNSVILGSLETQGSIQLKRVDYTTDFAPLRTDLNKIHYASANNPYLLQVYNLLK